MQRIFHFLSGLRLVWRLELQLFVVIHRGQPVERRRLCTEQLQQMTRGCRSLWRNWESTTSLALKRYSNYLECTFFITRKWSKMFVFFFKRQWFVFFLKIGVWHCLDTSLCQCQSFKNIIPSCLTSTMNPLPSLQLLCSPVGEYVHKPGDGDSLQ